MRVRINTWEVNGSFQGRLLLTVSDCFHFELFWLEANTKFQTKQFALMYNKHVT